MSSTRRGQRKTGVDNYPTPEWAIERFFEEWSDLHVVGPRWLEPCVGDGVIIDVANRFKPGIEWSTCDIRNTRSALSRYAICDHHVGDFFELEPFKLPAVRKFDVAIFNPPFRLTLEFIARCLQLAECVICMQRINYMGSEDRNEFFRASMPDLYVIPNRVSFTGDGKADSLENAWHVWGPHQIVGVGECRVLRHTPKEERARSRRRIVEARNDVSTGLDDLFAEVFS